MAKVTFWESGGRDDNLGGISCTDSCSDPAMAPPNSGSLDSNTSSNSFLKI